MEINKIYVGDSLEVLKTFPDGVIDCCITSPPYWALRDYGTTPLIRGGDVSCKHDFVSSGGKITHPTDTILGERRSVDVETKKICSKCGAIMVSLGLESSFNIYINHLCSIFDEVYRVMKDEGTLWVNIGDSYSQSGGSGSKEYSKRHTQFGKVVEEGSYVPPKKVKGLPPKCLCLIPDRFAIEMTRERGHIIKNPIDEAWLGAFIEGEGCITIANTHNYYEPRIQIGTTSLESLEKVRSITGVGTIRKATVNDNPKWRDSYIWKVGSVTAAKICADIFDHLVSKKEQARIVWRMYKMHNEIERKGTWKYSVRGLKYSEEQVKERAKWFEVIKAKNHGDSTPTGLPDPEKNKPWILRNRIIWYKPSCMPSSAKDRFTVDFEEIFFFVKQEKYFFNQQFETIQDITLERAKYKTRSKKTELGIYGGMDIGNQHKCFDKMLEPDYPGRNMRTTWKVPFEANHEYHYAAYPQKLISIPIEAGCPVNGVVLDPFMGSGTTGMVARKLNRNYVGIDLNPTYVKIAERRIFNEIGLFQ